MTTKTLTALALITAIFGCAGTDTASDTGPSASATIDGAVVLENGTKRPLISGLAYVREGFGDDELVIMLATWELNHCDIQYWFEQPGEDWNVIQIVFTGDEDAEVRVSQPFVFDGESDGSEGTTPRRQGAEIDVDPLADISLGQDINGSVWTSDVDWDSPMNGATANIASVDADFTVEFCGQLEEY